MYEYFGVCVCGSISVFLLPYVHVDIRVNRKLLPCVNVGIRVNKKLLKQEGFCVHANFISCV